MEQTEPIDKDVAVVLHNVFYFLFHFLLLGQLQFSHFSNWVDTNARSKNLKWAVLASLLPIFVVFFFLRNWAKQ